MQRLVGAAPAGLSEAEVLGACEADAVVRARVGGDMALAVATALQQLEASFVLYKNGDKFCL